VASFTPWPFYPHGKSAWYRLYRRLGGSQSHSEHGGGEEKNSYPLTVLQTTKLGSLLRQSQWSVKETLCKSRSYFIISHHKTSPLYRDDRWTLWLRDKGRDGLRHGVQLVT